MSNAGDRNASPGAQLQTWENEGGRTALASVWWRTEALCEGAYLSL